MPRLASIVFANIHIILIMANFLMRWMKMYDPKFYVTDKAIQIIDLAGWGNGCTFALWFRCIFDYKTD